AVGELLHLLHQRPLGVAAPRADQLARRLRQRRVVEDHAMHVEGSLELGRRAGRDVRLQLGEPLARRAQRRVEARDLGLDLGLLDLVVRDLEPRRRDEVRLADGDARGNRVPVQDEVHPAYSPSPNLSRMSCSSAARALSASLPSASIFTVLPIPAASIITPMMLFALTRRPLRESQSSHSKLPASWVSLAEARACSPSLLTISASALGIQTPVGVHVHEAFRASGKR